MKRWESWHLLRLNSRKQVRFVPHGRDGLCILVVPGERVGVGTFALANHVDHVDHVDHADDMKQRRQQMFDDR